MTAQGNALGFERKYDVGPVGAPEVGDREQLANPDSEQKLKDFAAFSARHCNSDASRHSTAEWLAHDLWGTRPPLRT